MDLRWRCLFRVRFVRTSVMAVFLLLLMFDARMLDAYSSGAPAGETCVTMFPGHGAAAQTSNSPYALQINTNENTITVDLSSNTGAELKGFLLQARYVGGSTDPVGTFTDPPANTKTSACTRADDTMTHSDSVPKTSLRFTWHPPSLTTGTGTVEFVATVVQEGQILWTDIRSIEYDLTAVSTGDGDVAGDNNNSQQAGNDDDDGMESEVQSQEVPNVDSRQQDNQEREDQPTQSPDDANNSNQLIGPYQVLRLMLALACSLVCRMVAL